MGDPRTRGAQRRRRSGVQRGQSGSRGATAPGDKRAATGHTCGGGPGGGGTGTRPKGRGEGKALVDARWRECCGESFASIENIVREYCGDQTERRRGRSRTVRWGCVIMDSVSGTVGLDRDAVEGRGAFLGVGITAVAGGPLATPKGQRGILKGEGGEGDVCRSAGIRRMQGLAWKRGSYELKHVTVMKHDPCHPAEGTRHPEREGGCERPDSDLQGGTGAAARPQSSVSTRHGSRAGTVRGRLGGHSTGLVRPSQQMRRNGNPARKRNVKADLVPVDRGINVGKKPFNDSTAGTRSKRPSTKCAYPGGEGDPTALVVVPLADPTKSLRRTWRGTNC